jgi:hypothetical protein
MSRAALPTKNSGVVLAKAARTFATAPSADGIYTGNEILNAAGYTTLIIRTMPAVEVGTSTFDLKVQGYDDIEALWYDIAGASLVQITANRTTPIDLVIGQYTAVANRVISQPVPYRARVHVTLGASGTDGFTFGVSYELHN